MDKDLKRRWVKALRSGQYQQGTGVLRRCTGDGDDVFCALGVLVDVAGYDWHITHGGSMGFYPKRMIEDFEPGDRWVEVSDLGWPQEFGLTQQQQEEVMRQNDEEGRSFEDIADWIERHL